MAFDVIIKALFTDSGVSAGLAKMNAGLNQLGRSGPGARAGLNAVQIGIRSLAFQAAGLTGGVGQLTRGLLSLGGGGALVLGVTAGIGAIVGIQRIATRHTRELREENERLTKSYQDLIAVGRPNVAAAQALGQATDEVAKAEEKLEAARARGRFIVTGRMVVERTPEQIEALSDVALARDNLRIAQLTADRRRGMFGKANEKVSEDAAKDAAKAYVAAFLAGLEQLGLGEKVTELLKSRNEFLRRGGEEAGKIWADAYLKAVDAAQSLRGRDVGMARVFGVGRIPVTFGQFGMSGTTTALGAPLPGQAPTFATMRLPSRFPAPEPVAAAKINAMEVAQLGQATMMMLLARGSGVGGGLSALGGFAGGLAGLGGVSAGLAGPLGWAGFGLSTLGSVFSLFDQSEERRHREAMERLTRIVQNTDTRDRPQNVDTHIYIDGREVTDRVLYEIRRAERRDATPRLPPR